MAGDDKQVSAVAVWTRRTLLKWGGATLVTLALPEVALGRPRKHQVKLDHLRRSSYRGLVGQHFRVAHARPLRLVHVQNLNSAQAGSETAFALVFSGPPVLAHQVPELHHPRLGSFRLLLAPGPATAHSGSYVAVINN